MKELCLRHQRLWMPSPTRHLVALDYLSLRKALQPQGGGTNSEPDPDTATDTLILSRRDALKLIAAAIGSLLSSCGPAGTPQPGATVGAATEAATVAAGEPTVTAAVTSLPQATSRPPETPSPLLEILPGDKYHTEGERAGYIDTGAIYQYVGDIDHAKRKYWNVKYGSLDVLIYDERDLTKLENPPDE